MRDPFVRPLPLLILALSLTLASIASAQQEDANQTPTDGNTTADGNATADGGDANATDGADAAPAATGATSITLTGHGSGSSFYYQQEGSSQRNPTLYVAPGQEITITLTTVSGGVHNIHVDGFEPSDYAAEGETITFTFTAPAEGETLEYWCDPHRGAGMAGRIVAGSPPPAGAGGGAGGEGGEISGPAIDLGDLGYPDCAGTMIPAIATQETVGNPTVADYVGQCRAAGDDGTETQGRASHPADLVIPLSFLAIAVGAVGVVWVHKYYKP